MITNSTQPSTNERYISARFEYTKQHRLSVMNAAAAGAKAVLSYTHRAHIDPAQALVANANQTRPIMSENLGVVGLIDRQEEQVYVQELTQRERDAQAARRIVDSAFMPRAPQGPDTHEYILPA